MHKRPDGPDRGDHIRSAIIFFTAWIGVVYSEVQEFKDGGLLQSIQRFEDGDLFPLFLVFLSVVLLALFIRSVVLYFQSARNTKNKDT